MTLKFSELYGYLIIWILIQIAGAYYIFDRPSNEIYHTVSTLIGFMTYIALQHLLTYVKYRTELKTSDVTVKDVTKEHQTTDKQFDGILFKKEG